MRAQSKWLLAFLLILALGAGGCGKKKQDAGAEAMETPDADTATVDDGSNASEAAPVIEEEKPPAEEAAAAPEKSAEPEDMKTSGELATYTVQKGDTLMKIAFNIYGDIARWKNLYDWNKDILKKASVLERGQKLKYQKPMSEPVVERNGDPYLIKRGDTLSKIADEIYAKASMWKKLWENNRSLIKDPNKIYAGFYLYYQITEQEKKLAETRRAKRGGAPAAAAGGGESAAAETGGAESPAAAAAAPAAPAAPAAAAPAATPNPAQTGASTGGGGLNALTNMRQPASAPAKH